MNPLIMLFIICILFCFYVISAVLRDKHPLVSIDYEILVNSAPSSPSFYQYSVLIDFVNNTFSQELLHSLTVLSVVLSDS